MSDLEQFLGIALEVRQDFRVSYRGVEVTVTVLDIATGCSTQLVFEDSDCKRIVVLDKEETNQMFAVDPCCEREKG